ncbi:MAG: hypothetical protein K0Q48_3392 [Bacillota bacterium]|jgi:acyl carrier protein|nr:hypothetical protein [Bacillota bacterium]
MKDEILEKIMERGAYLWGRNKESLNGDTTFTEVKAKSAHISQITTFLEDIYDVEIPYMGFTRCKTLGEAAAFVEQLLD